MQWRSKFCRFILHDVFFFMCGIGNSDFACVGKISHCFRYFKQKIYYFCCWSITIISHWFRFITVISHWFRFITVISHWFRLITVISHWFRLITVISHNYYSNLTLQAEDLSRAQLVGSKICYNCNKKGKEKYSLNWLAKSNYSNSKQQQIWHYGGIQISREIGSSKYRG